MANKRVIGVPFKKGPPTVKLADLPPVVEASAVAPADIPRKLTRAEKLEIKSTKLKQKNYYKKLRKLPWYRKKMRREADRKARLNQLEAAIKDPPPVPALLPVPTVAVAAPISPPVGKVPDDIEDDVFVERVVRQKHFRDTVGGANTEDPRVTKFLKMIGELQNRSFTWCARSCGLSNSDLARIWRDSNLSEAFFRIINKMPALADKLISDAMGAQKACTRCDGIGYITVPLEMRSIEIYADKETIECPQCKGQRLITGIGSVPDKQIVFEKIGWIRQARGVNVNVNMNSHSVDATVGELDGIEGEILEHRQ